ncbi:MAG: AAA family ATPase [Planctomycetes bacterium]|nr:AAA family ATPase [Planctomycetota bacterium]
MSHASPRYEKLAEIGRGATGTVHRVRLLEPWLDLGAGTELAVKALHPSLIADSGARERFRTEGVAGLRVKHPNLVRVLHFDDGEAPRILMALVGGRTLERALEEQGPFPEPQVRAIGAQVAAALAALHAKGWSHNDVKPENVRWDDTGRAVLLDLGFARKVARSAERAESAATLDLAHADGVNPGSLAYLAPERARGESGSPAGDVFALGVTLYRLATGRHPFADDTNTLEHPAELHEEAGFSSAAWMRNSLDTPGADRMLAAMATARFVPPSRIVPRLSPFFDALIEELLRRDSEVRPNAAEVAARFTANEASPWWRAQLDPGPASRRGSLGSPDAAHFLPLVGRDAELARLAGIWASVIGGEASRGRAVWVHGPAGAGKSRFVGEFGALVRRSEDPPLYLYARCTQDDDSRPCAAILRLLQRYLQLPPGAKVGERERAWLGRIVPPREASTLANALDADFEGASGTAVDAALARWLLALGRRAPLVVFVDDVNFAGEGTLEVLLRLCEELAASKTLLVLGWRDGEDGQSPSELARLRERLREKGLDEELTLGAIDESAIETLVMELFHHTAPRLRIAQVLFARSRGNPGLVAEILRGLLDRGTLRPFSADDRRFVLSIAPDELPLPESLHQLIGERFQKLPPEDRAWLGRLAVVGGRIDSTFLQRAFAPVTRAEVDAMLARLVRAEWLVPAGGRYRFARPALREAVYRGLGDARKRRLHSLAAAALAPTRGRRMSLDDAFQRAFHLRAASEHAALLRLLAPLIAALERRGQPQRVHSLASWGLDALDALAHTKPRDRIRIRLLEAAADASDRLAIRAEQRQWLDQLSNLDLSPDEDTEALARVYLLHGRYAVATGQFGLARGMLRNAVELARRREDCRELESEALRRLSAVQAHVGELQEARRLALDALERAVHDPQKAVAWLNLGVIELLEDDIEEALRTASRALAHMRAAPDWQLPGVLAAAYMLRGRTYRLAGLLRRALGSMDRAVRLAEQAGERRLEMEATARLGGLLLDANRVDDAEARLREALRIANEIEDRRGQALAGLWLGILLAERLDPEAERLLARVSTLSGEIGLARVEALALAVSARIYVHQRRHEQAEAAATRAHELLERHGAELADRIVITGTFALVLEALGRSRAARELVKTLRARLRVENRRLRAPALRRGHRVASTRLLEEVLSAEGTIYPRVELDLVTPEADESR